MAAKRYPFYVKRSLSTKNPSKLNIIEASREQYLVLSDTHQEANRYKLRQCSCIAGYLIDCKVLVLITTGANLSYRMDS